MSSAILSAANELRRIAPEMLEDGEEFSFTYEGNPPCLVMVAVGQTAQDLYQLASSLTTVTGRNR